MKKISFLLPLIALAMVSCDNSPLAKADRLVRKEMPQNLFFPDSYDPVETVIDSAFYPKHDPQFWERVDKTQKKLDKYSDLCTEIHNTKNRINSSQRTILMLSGSYISDFERFEIRRERAEIEELKKKMGRLIKERDHAFEVFKKAAEEIKAESEQTPVFIGFNAAHRFRCKNNLDQIIIEDFYFLVDKELENLIHNWSDKDLERIKNFEETIDELVSQAKAIEE